MEGLIPRKKRNYEEFRASLPSNVATLFDDLRSHCFSLGKNVVEDIRMHRIVFSKSMTFRNFADIEPQRDSVILKIKRDRKEPEKEVEIKINDSLDDIKKSLSEAYANIH
jgi:predicted transport protein